MAVFPRQLYNSTASVTPLIRLSNDYFSGNSGGRHIGISHWQPKFDVRETAEAYELYGEIPGVSKDQIYIEFLDPRTIRVRGEVKRQHYSTTSPTEEDQSSSKATTHNDSNMGQDYHQSAVESEPMGTMNDDDVVNRSKDKTILENSKYLFAERNIGEFSRSFAFPISIEQESASAGYKEGILQITLPKTEKPETYRVVII